MLQPSTLTFLKNLKKNNVREWLEANRKIYDNAKIDFTTLVTEVITQFGKKDTDIATLTAKECVFRINRDVRFSNDKSPYKTNMGAYFSKGGKKSILSGYYFHFEPGNSFIGGGLWMPEADSIKKVRQEIDYSWEEFSAIIHNKKFVAQYGELQRREGTVLIREPKGYEKDNPAIEYIKLKSWVASAPITDEDITGKNAVKKIVTAFETLQPMIIFLNRALEG
ncbi:hypothetical protein F5148DRAFT_990550 [Russula earlei]|uniref:Uncharacterized protein n=1 Tax=Russula earlei TaxID=71964 RepID=A0ACC0TQE3_9AGAM|nr:hypothetical protein F5148DRAFT_990550 [Russula earlei]